MEIVVLLIYKISIYSFSHTGIFHDRCTYLYDTLRPKLIHETNLDFLCELVDILKVEVLGEQLSRRSESLAGLRPTLHRILADVHERLTFRARTYIRDEVGLDSSGFSLPSFCLICFMYFAVIIDSRHLK